MHRQRGSERFVFPCAALAALLFFLSPSRGGEVVLNEVFTSPGPTGDVSFQYVELKNPSFRELGLTGWYLSGDITFSFPEGTVLLPGGMVVVCHNTERFRLRFSPPEVPVLGDCRGRLKKTSGRIEVRDSRNRVIDLAVWRSGPPWPEIREAGSLSRICPQGWGYLGRSWAVQEPTPGSENEQVACPPPEVPPTPVVISEIHYHPPGTQDPRGEFIEVMNRTGGTVDMTGWRLTGGVQFAFPEGAVLRPGSFFIVCADAAFCRDVLGLAGIVGTFQGRLSNRGEALFLRDPEGVVRDGVWYDTEEPYPAAPDGGGFSLERVSSGWSGEDPANWATCVPQELLSFSDAVGEIHDVLPGLRPVWLYLEEEGQCLIDAVVVEDITDPEAPQVLFEDDFSEGLGNWRFSPHGISSTSRWVEGAGRNRSGALLLSSARSCPTGCTQADGVWRYTPALEPKRDLRFHLWWKPVRGSAQLRCMVDDDIAVAAAPRGIHTGGAPNSQASSHPRPRLVGVGRYPEQPTSSDSVLLSVTLASVVPVEGVFLKPAGGGGSVPAVALSDDGQSSDRLPGDGVWSATLPPLPDGSTFLFTLQVHCADGRRYDFPRPFEESRYYGYFVSDNQPETELPVYTIVDPAVTAPDTRSVYGRYDCLTYRPAHFVYRGEVYPEVMVRLRGNTGCLMLKRHFKVRFNRGRLFRGLRKINLNSMYTDKAYFREHMAWEFLRDIGSAYCRTEFVRLHLNSWYWGFYLYVEHPDSHFLERNNLDPNGDLYKALMGPRGPGDCDWTPGVVRYRTPEEYSAYWEKETNENGDFSSLISFIEGLHHSEGALQYLRSHVDAESVILFQVGQTALRNFDSVTKNIFLYHNPASGRWHYLPWDLDLSFGKFFTFDAVGLGRPVGTLNDIMACPRLDLAVGLYYGAEWIGECDQPGNYLAYFFFSNPLRYYDRAYKIRLWDVLQEKYRSERFDLWLARLENSYGAEVEQDIAMWPRYPSNADPPTPPDLHSNVEILKEQISCIRDQLVAMLHAEIRSHPRLRFTELMVLPFPVPEGGDQRALEFVELYNPDGRAVNAGSWRIEGLGFTFPPETVVAPHGVVVVARDPEAFRRLYGFTPFGPYSGELRDGGMVLRLYDEGPGGTFPAVVDYLAYENGGQGWPELWRGHSLEFTLWRDQYADNDQGELWRRSTGVGGTPGVLPGGGPPFRRGDANDDGTVGIADAVFTLGALFGSHEALLCRDAADSNNDGRINLADPVYTLAYLFAGGAKPPEPFSACGSDWGESLGCVAFESCRQ